MTDELSESVLCTEGHIHHVDDLDSIGQDYFCPECFSKIEPGQVTDANHGRNEMPSNYLSAGNTR